MTAVLACDWLRDEIASLQSEARGRENFSRILLIF